MVKKRKPGRPTVLTDAVESKLLDLATDGQLVIDACRKLKISYRTVAKREREDPLFMQALARARVAGAAFRLERAEKKLDRATNSNIAVVREQVQHMRWIASKLIPSYKDRLEVQGKLTVNDSDPPAKPLEQWTRDEKLEWVRRQLFTMATIGKELRDLWGLENLASGYGYLGDQTWQQILAVIDGRPPVPPAGLLPAPPETVQPKERELNPTPQRGDEVKEAPTFIPSRDEMGLE
jgi:hypothetical protein